MTKIFGRPSLRCGFIGTPDKSLAQHIPAITKDVSPSMAYDMMADAMAIWDFVKHEDQMRFFEMLHSRQLKMLDILTERPDIFDLEESFISGPEREKESEEEDALAAFYLYIKVKEGINTLFMWAFISLFVVFALLGQMRSFNNIFLPLLTMWLLQIGPNAVIGGKP